MAAVVDATVGGASSNSYETVVEADAYFESRLPLSPAWDTASSKAVLLIMGTRTLESVFQPTRTYVPAMNGRPAYYIARRQWTGAPATTTQRLSWPRTGMYDRNGNLIPSNVIPQELKDALSEFSGQLLKADTTLNNDVIVQGLKSVGVGSVSLSFKDYFRPQVMPDAVLNLLLSSWLTDEVISYPQLAEFDVLDT